MTIFLRAADPQDASAIGRIVKAAYGKWVTVIGREPLPMQVDYDVAVPQNLHRFTIATEGDQIVGLIEMESRGDHIWIENVAVAPDAQGKGVGRLLMARAEKVAASCALSEVRLLTNGDFKANISFYQNLNYEVSVTAAFCGGTVVYMSKKL